ncbi:MAG: DUF1579 domain-containing protein [Phycisphaerales bacterium JB060]
MERPKPLWQHDWLTRLVGTWTYSGKGDMGPDQPPHEFSGREVVRSMGGLWIVCEGTCSMPGGSNGDTLMTLGYDPAASRFVGSWAGSMMTFMFRYEGRLDEAGKILTLDTAGPTFAPDAAPGTMAHYQDIIEQVSDTHRILRSRMVHEDGSYTQFMEAHYHRQ